MVMRRLLGNSKLVRIGGVVGKMKYAGQRELIGHTKSLTMKILVGVRIR